ncbi:unnamed protein product [Brassicogethes aeneus]|uniref:receptor protein-tyrosine kinase n=1 Tax=Brassicogethes aeneus TaxID=1431903 RepID=A0A9P0FF65_BRAAE|nr:unnamed protein product [Brassicogethes aeneus]
MWSSREAWTKRQQAREWQQSPGCNTGKTLMGSGVETWSVELLKLSRPKIRAVVEIVSGHNNLNKHRYVIGKTTSPRCERCEEEIEDSQHFLCKCVALARTRFAVFGQTEIHPEQNLLNINITCRPPKYYLKDIKEILNMNADPPVLHCEEHNLINIKWNKEESLRYFLEVYDVEKRHKTYSDMVKCNNYTITNLTADSEYHIRLWSISNETIFSYSKILNVKTPMKDFSKNTVEKIGLKNLNLINSSYQAVIHWNTTKEKNCYFDVVWFENEYLEDLGDYKQIELKKPYSLHELKLDQLKMGNTYSLAIMTTSETSHIESVKSWFNFTTPNCLESFKSLNMCEPNTPLNMTLQEAIVEFNNNIPVYNVKINWETPEYYPEYYLVQLITFNMNSTVTTLNITGTATEAIFLNTDLGSNYQVSLTAWSKAGSSRPAFQHKIVDANKILITKAQTNVKLILAIVFPIVAILSSFILYLFISKKYMGKDKKEMRCEYFKEADQSMPEPNEENHFDEWELDYKKLLFQKVLGEGAFGIVKRAFYEEDNEVQKDVAIKMLKDSPTQAELREFYQEMEIMKMVGSHPHLVSMIGCITKNTNQGPLLIVEYCAKGDLQSFLRNIWEKITNQSTRYVNLPESQMHCNNRLYDFDRTLQDDFNLQSTDIISYARQVSMGMEYLSSLRVLHRDLAARNVLVCEDGRTVKISDFGLSRDVYQDDVYCKSGAGKLPIRWMALESVTHQRYTTQSDVWSFGVLLWEIVTLGGNPYPGVNNQDVLFLLKQGYRMSKPVNCSEELYAIMAECWYESPNDRPTFADLSNKLENLLEKKSEYLSLDANMEDTAIIVCSQGYLKPIDKQ